MKDNADTEHHNRIEHRRAEQAIQEAESEENVQTIK